MSWWVGMAFSGIFLSLALALYFMLRSGSSGVVSAKQMARALTFRIALSVLLFACVLAAWALGWIEPTGMVLRA